MVGLAILLLPLPVLVPSSGVVVLDEAEIVGDGVGRGTLDEIAPALSAAFRASFFAIPEPWLRVRFLWLSCRFLLYP